MLPESRGSLARREIWVRQMDNIAHTLVGAALGRAVADRRLRYASVIGAVAANAPDWTELLLGVQADRVTYLTLHRGITHSFLGAFAQIAGLTLVAWAGWRFLARGRLVGLPLARSIALCTTAAVLSHLYMDWQGSYGVRPFLPSSSRWYYGDLVAITDVFFWIVPLIGLAWGAQRHWLPALTFGLPLAAATVLPLIAYRLTERLPALPLGATIGAMSLLALAMVGWMRYWFGPVARRAAAATALVSLVLYVLVHVAAGFTEKLEIRRTARARFGERADWAALTIPGRPLTWEAVYASRDSVAGDGWVLPRRLDDPLVQQALATPAGRAMAQFARFLTAEVDTAEGAGSGGGGRATVYLRDARYARERRDGWGVLPVRLRSSLPTAHPRSGARPIDGAESDSGALLHPRGDHQASGVPPARR